MVALLVSLAGALVLGLITYVPPLLGRDSGVAPTAPGLLQVAPDAVGVVTLGDGRAVRLDEGGMTLTHEADVLFQSVRGGSPVTALVGEVDGEGSERSESVDAALSNLEVTRLSISPGVARWTGELTEGERSMPVEIEVRYEEEVIALDVEVEGADGVIVHSIQDYRSIGRRPALPSTDLQRKAWWVAEDTSADTGAYISYRQTEVAVGPGDADRAVDLRLQGRTDIHVWDPAAQISVSSRRLVP